MSTLTFLIGLSVVLFLIWLFELITHLRRTDLSDTDRIVWTIVLCTLNILGVVLYRLYAPNARKEDIAAKRRRYLVESEAELKARFNRGG